ncbi:MAG: DUF58 domain-containing protein [Actinomycetota bacterium]|nr:DUF58 domain-containing protein [Actinomycetota bacterium]
MKPIWLIPTAVAFSLFLIASSMKSGWLYLVSSVMFALVIADSIYARHSTRSLSLKRECPDEVYEGEDFEVALDARNKSRIPAFFLRIQDEQFLLQTSQKPHGIWRKIHQMFFSAQEELAMEERRRRKWEQSVFVERVGGRAELKTSYSLRAPKRGVYSNARMCLQSNGILGTSASSLVKSIPSEIVVFPKPYPLSYFPCGQVESATYSESFESARRGYSQDYYGVREYVRGDSLKSIHWKSTAKRGKLIVKEYQQEIIPLSYILLLLAAPLWGDEIENSLEDGLRATASILRYFSYAGRKTGLLFFENKKLEMVEGELENLLSALASYVELEESTEIGELAGAFSFPEKRLSRESQVIFVTNYKLEDVSYFIREVAPTFSPILVEVLEESYAPSFNSTTIGAGESLGAISERLGGLYIVTHNRGIETCLNAPSNITGG